MDSRTAESPPARDQQDDLQCVVDALPWLVAHVGCDLRYRFVNLAFAHWFDSTPERLVNRSVSDVLGERAFATLRPHIERALAGERSEFQTVISDSDGGEHAVQASLAPLSLRGEPAGFIVSITDIGAFSPLDAEREAARMRDDFLSIAAHELRTPLTALQLQVVSIERLLKDVLDADKVRVRAKKAARTVVRLSTLVNGLLDVSRISAGRLSLQLALFDLSDAVSVVLARVADDFAPCELIVELEGGLTGLWDRQRIEQVLTTVLSRAHQIGAHKPIEVRLVRRADRACLSVKDGGDPMSLDEQKRVFERTVPLRHAQGFALVLWVARQLVEAHGGALRIHSMPSAGTTFEVELKLDPVPT